MVSDEPSITDATFPAKESGPWVSKISFMSAKAPLPETDFKRAKGKTSLGILTFESSGESIFPKKSKAPDARSIDTAQISPTKAGSMLTEVFKLFDAPFKKVSKIFTFLNSA